MAYDRLTAQDATFLHVESEAQPQHIGSLGLFEAAPLLDDKGRLRIDDARALIGSRLHLVPRFRKRIVEVPLEQGRPVWIDDDRFDLSYHVRLTALPQPGTEAQLDALFARLQSHLLDRRRPLWEVWFVEGVAGGQQVAMIQKTHHCLVDGISGVDVATVLLDLEPDPPRTEAPPWEPEPSPRRERLLVDSLVERATQPAEIARSIRAGLRGPRSVADRVLAVGKSAIAASKSPDRMPWNVPITPHRRWVKARVSLEDVRAVKDGANVAGITPARCTVNDVVLAACTTALRSFLESREEPTDGLTLKVGIPVSMRDDSERGALGNRVSMLVTELPVGEPDPIERLRLVHESVQEAKGSGQAVGADALVQMTNYLPPTVLSRAARLLVRSLPMNLTITNVPGPQFPLYCMGARMLEAFPYVLILDGQALNIAVLSYDGELGFGITGDRDVLPDLELVSAGIGDAVIELRDALANASERGTTAT